MHESADTDVPVSCALHPDLLPLELLLLDEIEGGARAEVEERLKDCRTCAAIYKQMRQDDALWREADRMREADRTREAALPPEAALRKEDVNGTGARHGRASSRLAPVFALAALLLAASVATLLFFAGDRESSDTQEGVLALAERRTAPHPDHPLPVVDGARVFALDTDVRAKGEGLLDLDLYIRDQRGTRRAALRDRVAAGDRFGFRLTIREAGYIAVVGVDPVGRTYPCFPLEANADASHIPAAPVALEPLHAMELDATPGIEDIVAVHCRAPFTTDTLKDALRDYGADALESSTWMRESACSHVRFTLEKDVP